MRLIDADALKSKVQAQEWKRDPAVMLALDWIYMLINEQPTIDAVPVVRGEWIPTDMGGGEADEAYVCSACGEPWTLIDGTPHENNMNYCPNCGAKMEGERRTRNER